MGSLGTLHVIVMTLIAIGVFARLAWWEVQQLIENEGFSTTFSLISVAGLAMVLVAGSWGGYFVQFVVGSLVWGRLLFGVVRGWMSGQPFRTKRLSISSKGEKRRLLVETEQAKTTASDWIQVLGSFAVFALFSLTVPVKLLFQLLSDVVS